MYAFFPLVVFLDMWEITVASDALAFGRDVIKIVFLVTGRKLDGIERKGFEIFFRHKPRLMRTIDPAGEKERFVVFFLKLFAYPFRNEIITAIRFVAEIKCGPVGLAVLPRATDGKTDRAILGIAGWRKRIVF